MKRAYLYVVSNWSSWDDEDGHGHECYPSVVMSNVLLTEDQLADKVRRWSELVSGIRVQYDEECRRTRQEVEDAAKKALREMEPSAIGDIARTKGMSWIEDKMRGLQELVGRIGEITHLAPHQFFFHMDCAIRDIVNDIVNHGRMSPEQLVGLARDYGVQNTIIEIRQRWQDATMSFDELRLVIPTAEFHGDHSMDNPPISGGETVLWEDEG